MNRNLKKVIGITTTAVAGMYIINRIVDYTAGTEVLKDEDFNDEVLEDEEEEQE